MKQFFVMALAAAAVVGCSKKEGAPAPTGPGEQLNIVTSIATAPKESMTKTAVDGTTLPVGSVIGVHLADGTATTNDFTPSNTTGNGNYLYYTSGRNVRFSNAAGANIWASVDEDENTKLLLFSNKPGGQPETAKVYAYYPYVTETEAATMLEGNGDATTLQIPLLLTGAIDASTYDGKNVKVATANDEKDYMFHQGEGETVVGAQTTTTAKLVMKHALARVAFIVYTSQDAQQAIQGDGTSYYRLDGYTIKNKAQGTDLKLNSPYAKMALKDGTITPGTAGGQIDRTITNYKMQKDADGTGTTAIGASAKVGNLMYPISITTTSNGGDGTKSTDMEVVFHIARVATGGSANAPVGYAIPFNTQTVKNWEAGKSYTYTVKFTGNSLSIETVSVTDWVEQAAGDMEIE